MVAGLMAVSLLTTNTSCADYLDKEPDTELDIEMLLHVDHLSGRADAV